MTKKSDAADAAAADSTAPHVDPAAAPAAPDPVQDAAQSKADAAYADYSKHPTDAGYKKYETAYASVPEDKPMLAPVSSIETSAPPGGGSLRKPKDWEPPHVSVVTHDVVFNYAMVAPDTSPLKPSDDPDETVMVGDPAPADAKPWVVSVGFQNEVDARNFYAHFSNHIKKSNAEYVVAHQAPIA